MPAFKHFQLNEKILWHLYCQKDALKIQIFDAKKWCLEFRKVVFKIPKRGVLNAKNGVQDLWNGPLVKSNENV